MSADFKSYIRDVPDFPRPGVIFRDISPLLAEPRAFRAAVAQLGLAVQRHRADALVAVEARGFIFGAALAQHLGLPLHLVRKRGKLPPRTADIRYALEYGEDRLEVREDAVHPQRRYAVIDDVLATGGTVAATVGLLRGLGGQIACCAMLIELAFLLGRAKLPDVAVESLIIYD